VLADAGGQQVLNTVVAKGQPLPKRAEVDAVRAVFATEKPQISNMHISAVIPQALFSVDVPVFRGDDVIYDLSFNPPRQIFYDIIGALGVPENWIVSIVDKKLQHVARRPALQTQGVTQPAESLRIEMAKAREGIAPTVSLEGIPLITAYTYSDISGWAVAIGIPEEAVAAPARFAIYFTVGVGAILMLIGLAFASRLARQLANAEADRELLMNELNHRVKNTLSSVQAIVQRTLRNDAVPDATRKAVESRLLALSHAHNSLSAASWSDADLREIAGAILSPYLDPAKTRAQLSGPDVRVQPRVAIALSMVLNELVTNAAKYGALSVPGGQVQLTWTLLEGRILRFEWQERGGPPVQPPQRTGFGTQFIQRAVTQELGGAAEALYLPTGLTWILELPL
jgi:two-component sensor histidine kinase